MSQVFIQGGRGRIAPMAFARIRAVLNPLRVELYADGNHFGFIVGSNAEPRSPEEWEREIIRQLAAELLWPVPVEVESPEGSGG